MYYENKDIKNGDEIISNDNIDDKWKTIATITPLIIINNTDDNNDKKKDGNTNVDDYINSI